MAKRPPFVWEDALQQPSALEWRLDYLGWGGMRSVVTRNTEATVTVYVGEASAIARAGSELNFYWTGV
jgi:hypothetical protein